MLVDNFGRDINYLRLAVTDRCNLRCFYCMPEEGIQFKKRSHLLSYEEITRIVSILAKVGVNKIRITGGEPFLRKDVISLMRSIKAIDGIEKLALTTNGTLTSQYLPELLKMGVNQFNLSLDSVDPERFFKITRRDSFQQVWDFFLELVHKGLKPKINAVVMDGQNIEDILPMVELTREMDVSVRFIEEMPFNGSGKNQDGLKWNYKKILSHIQSEFPSVEKLQDAQYSTSLNYKVEGFKGSFGIIPAYSRTFCGTCNRLRLTPEGIIKTCLYDEGVFNIKDMIRAGANDDQVLSAIQEAIGHRAKDGFEAEARRSSHNVSESMATIGG